MSTKHEFNMVMTCSGCSGAAIRVLGKAGIEDGNIIADLDKKKVFVTSDKSAEELLAILKKTGKEVSYVGTA